MTLSSLQSLSFSGCGTLNYYQTGVAHCLQRRGMSSDMKYAGASAGAGLGVLLAADIDAYDIFQVAQRYLEPYANRSIVVHPEIISEFSKRFLQHFLDGNVLSRIQGRVFISITRVKTFSNLLVDAFSDMEDLRKAIRASCHIPSYRWPTTTFRGMRCVDGGFTRNNPIVGDRCLKVSPFRFMRSADIRPSVYLAPWNALVVPSPKQAKWLFEQGCADAERYLQSAPPLKAWQPFRFPFADRLGAVVRRQSKVG